MKKILTSDSIHGKFTHTAYVDGPVDDLMAEILDGQTSEYIVEAVNNYLKVNARNKHAATARKAKEKEVLEKLANAEKSFWITLKAEGLPYETRKNMFRGVFPHSSLPAEEEETE